MIDSLLGVRDVLVIFFILACIWMIVELNSHKHNKKKINEN
jgi:hypothetical protein